MPTGGNSSLPLSVHGGHMETACAEHKKCSSTVFEHIAISLLKLCHSYPPVKHFELTCDWIVLYKYVLSPPGHGNECCANKLALTKDDKCYYKLLI